MIQQADLHLGKVIGRWNLWRRLQHALTWTPRGIIFGLGAAVLLALAARLRPLFTTDETLALGGALALGGGLVALVIVWLWPRSALDSARYYDLRFDLKERLSTALELAAGHHRSALGAEILSLQQQDALQRARGLDVRARLPLHLHWRDWVNIVVLVVVFLLLVFLPNNFAQAVSEKQALEGAIASQVQDLQEMRETVESNPNLSDEAREEILETLDETMENLQQPRLSREEAMATLSDAGEELRETAERDAAEAAPPELQEAGEILRQGQQAQESEAMQPAEPREIADALNSLAEAVEGMSSTEREGLARQLEQAANALESTNPELAQQLREAAEALREGNVEEAQAAMQQAAEQMQQQAQQSQQTQELTQQMQQQLSEGQQQLSQQSQQSQQEGQQGQQGQEGQQEEGQQSGEQGGEGGEPSGQGESTEGEPGDGGVMDENADASSGAAQSGEGQQPSQVESQGMQMAQGAQDAPDLETQSGGLGAGTGEGAFDQPQEGAQSSGPMTANNAPGGSGERTYAPIFAPSRIGGESDMQLDLPVDPEELEDAPVIQGDTVPEGTGGESLVPYSQVYGDYANAANDALESGRIPLGMRAVIREYFISLAP